MTAPKVQILNDAEGRCVYVQVGDNILIRTYQAYGSRHGSDKLEKCGVYVNVGYGTIAEYTESSECDEDCDEDCKERQQRRARRSLKEKPWVLSRNWDLKETVDAVLGQPGYDPNG
jgi:hypothetical protein